MFRSIRIKQFSFLTAYEFFTYSYLAETTVLLFSKKINSLCTDPLHFYRHSAIINLIPYNFKETCHHPISYYIKIDLIYIKTTYTIESLLLILTKGEKYFLFLIGKNKFNSRRAML